MKTRDKVIIGVLGACLAVAAGIWMEVRTCRRMRAAVEQALEMNRTFQPFTSDTIYLSPHSSPTSTPFPSGDGRGEAISLRDAVAYYRHPLRCLWTSPNDRLRAGYALGCVYRDLHEAPIAIITWEDAVAAADTTAEDCDYAILYRVYGQMADIFRNQHLPEKQLEADSLFCKYALLAGDTLVSIRGQLLCNAAYYTLGDTAAIFANSEAVRQQYLELGRVQEAAQVYPTPIHVAVESGQYTRARRMMDEYEHNSGLFGADGFITDATRAQYHSYKGHYYLGIHEIDSAERQFRKLLSDSRHLMDAYRGLLAVYQKKGNTDSILRYSQLLEQSLIAHQSSIHSVAIIQAQGMYDYNRQEREARRQTKKAGRLTYTLTCVIFLVLIASIYALLYHQKKEEEKANLVARYSKAVDDLSKTKHEVQLLKVSISKDSAIKKLLKEKEEQIKEFEDIVKKLQKRMGCSAEIISMQKLEETAIVKKFKAIIEPHYEDDADLRVLKPARAATEEEWEMMKEVIQVCHPTLYLLIHKHKLSPLKLKVCVLSYLGFKNPDISILSGASMDSIPNARTALAKELFGLTSAHDLDDHLRLLEPLA